MATTTATNAGSLTVGGIPYSPERISVLQAVFDASATPIPNGDTHNLLAIPEGFLVLYSSAKVTTVEGAADTLDLRCGTTVLINELDVNTAARTNSATARMVPSGGEYINFTTGAAAAAVTVAVVEVSVLVIDMRVTLD